MRTGNRPPFRDSANGATIVLAGLIIVGMMGAGYYFFVHESGPELPAPGAPLAQRVVPLTPAEVVQRASDNVTIGIFAAQLATEKTASRSSSSRSTGPKDSARPVKKAGPIIENIGVRGDLPSKSFDPRSLRKKAPKVDNMSDEDREIKRLRELRAKMLREERKRAREEAEAF